MKRLILIPARGGSKGVPGKNIKELNGKPLIYYTIEAARELFSDDEIYLSTEDLQIKECAGLIGLNVPFIRPKELASDTSSTYDLLLHAIKFAEDQGYNPDVLILLQPTSPFRNGNQIREALSLYNDKLDMVVSVKESKSNPYFNLFEESAEGLLEKSKPGKYIRRQDCPKVWEYNGAIYIINVNSLKKYSMSEFKMIKKYVMDESSSHDIDTQLDWLVAEVLSTSIK